MMITIPAETTLIGEIRSKGRIRIDGHVEGKGEIDGLLLLTRSCVWKGKLTADEVIVEGTVEGDIIARKRLEIHANAKVTGSIVCPNVEIMAGASFTGNLKMSRPKPPIGLLENQKKKQAQVKKQLEQAVTAKAVGE
jgi:cytoskeletal protein CcmA (bactofilin family)